MTSSNIYAGKFGKCGKMIIRPYSISEEERPIILKIFLAFVDVSITDCWLWKGRIHNGYACCQTPNGTKWAHRVSYALFNGGILGGMRIDHKCRNSRCVRPDHLEQMTPTENYLAIHRRKRRDIKKAQEKAGQLSILNYRR